jgi:hypothetical protein
MTMRHRQVLCRLGPRRFSVCAGLLKPHQRRASSRRGQDDDCATCCHTVQHFGTQYGMFPTHETFSSPTSDQLPARCRPRGEAGESTAAVSEMRNVPFTPMRRPSREVASAVVTAAEHNCGLNESCASRYWIASCYWLTRPRPHRRSSSMCWACSWVQRAQPLRTGSTQEPNQDHGSAASMGERTPGPPSSPLSRPFSLPKSGTRTMPRKRESTREAGSMARPGEGGSRERSARELRRRQVRASSEFGGSCASSCQARRRRAPSAALSPSTPPGQAQVTKPRSNNRGLLPVPWQGRQPKNSRDAARV